MQVCKLCVDAINQRAGRLSDYDCVFCFSEKRKMLKTFKRSSHTDLATDPRKFCTRPLVYVEYILSLGNLICIYNICPDGQLYILF